MPPLATWSNFRPGSDTRPAHWDPEDLLHWHVPRVGHTWAIAREERNAQQQALNGNSAAEAEGCHDIRPRAKARVGPKHIQLLEGYCASVEQPAKPMWTFTAMTVKPCLLQWFLRYAIAAAAVLRTRLCATRTLSLHQETSAALS